MAKLYCLKDQNGEIRYIGKTMGSLNTRLSSHVCDAKRKNETNHRATWIRSCLKDGFKPIIELIEEVDGDGCAREIELIKEYRDNGYRLVNSTDGGEGTLGHKLTPEQLEKRSGPNAPWWGKKHTQEWKKMMSEKHTGAGNVRYGVEVSQETRDKMSKSRKGMKLSDEAKQNIAAAKIGEKNPFYGKTHTDELKMKWSKERKGKQFSLGFKHTEETKKKMSLASTGRIKSPEAREKISKAHKGKKKLRKSIIKKVRNAGILPIICNENNKIYELMSDIIKDFPIKMWSLWKCIHGLKQSTNGYSFRYLTQEEFKDYEASKNPSGL